MNVIEAGSSAPRSASESLHASTNRLSTLFDATDRLPVALITLGALAGYYLGSIIGLQLRLPATTPSVVWPPNAVLTSALVLTVPRYWWVLLLAVLPAHLYLQLGTWPLPLVLSMFVTNCLEAILAAGGMRLLSDVPWRFDTQRRLTAFLVAGIGAALVSSFADAAGAHWLHGDPYWSVWQTRLFSNVLAVVTVVPAVVGGAVALIDSWPRRRDGTRLLEAGVLAICIGAIAVVDLSPVLSPVPVLRALSSQAPLAVQLPFLVWAAVRFGTAGTGLALLVTTLTNAWAVVHHEGPFAGVDPATTVVALSLSLIVVAVTLLSLSTLLQERRRAQHELRRRLHFEALLSRLSAALVQEPSDQLVRVLDGWAGPIGELLALSGLSLFATEESAELRLLYSWTASDAGAADIAERHRRQASDMTLRRSAHVLSDAPAGLSSCAAIPLVGDGQLLGVLVFGPSQSHHQAEDMAANATLLTEVLAGALERQRSDAALRESEAMQSAILQSLRSGVGVIDRNGRLLQVNDTWRSLAHDCAWIEPHAGGNLMERWRTMSAHGDGQSAVLLDGVVGVLDGRLTRFGVETSGNRGGESGLKWWAVTAVPFNRTGGGVVVTLADITERHRAETAAQRSRQELAHVLRVATVGEMTASLAHQLSQPLTAILTNARVAQRILAAGSGGETAVPAGGDTTGSNTAPVLAQLAEILHDVGADSRRAADVILGLRRLLRKGELEMVSLNLTDAIHEVVQLVASEALIHHVAVSILPSQAPLFVLGDRVQLQQVILNLLRNAIEAMDSLHDRPRTIEIACRPCRDGSFVCVTVQDSGPGLPTGAEDTVFQPFYTTKVEGMGLGLSIVRSIVEAHGGTINAVSDQTGGACFEFVLPAAAVPSA